MELLVISLININKRLPMNIGKNIVFARKRIAMSQEVLAEKTGISKNRLRNIENGNIRPRSNEITVIAHTLNIPVYNFESTGRDCDELKQFSESEIATAIIERLALIEMLEPGEKKAIFTIIDSMISKKEIEDLLRKDE